MQQFVLLGFIFIFLPIQFSFIITSTIKQHMMIITLLITFSNQIFTKTNVALKGDIKSTQGWRINNKKKLCYSPEFFCVHFAHNSILFFFHIFSGDRHPLLGTLWKWFSKNPVILYFYTFQKSQKIVTGLTESSSYSDYKITTTQNICCH